MASASSREEAPCLVLSCRENRGPCALFLRGQGASPRPLRRSPKRFSQGWRDRSCTAGPVRARGSSRARSSLRVTPSSSARAICSDTPKPSLHQPHASAPGTERRAPPMATDLRPVRARTPFILRQPPRPVPGDLGLRLLPGREGLLQLAPAFGRQVETMLAAVRRRGRREPAAALEKSGAAGEDRALQAEQRGQFPHARLALEGEGGQDGELGGAQPVPSQPGVVEAGERPGRPAGGQAAAGLRSAEVDPVGHSFGVYTRMGCVKGQLRAGGTRPLRWPGPGSSCGSGPTCQSCCGNAWEWRNQPVRFRDSRRGLHAQPSLHSIRPSAAARGGGRRDRGVDRRRPLPWPIPCSAHARPLTSFSVP